MSRFIDARIPVFFGPAVAAAQDDAILMEGEGTDFLAQAWFLPAEPGHAAACVCCTSRSPAGQAFARLFLLRARGGCGFFRRLVAVTNSPAGRDAVLAALEEDPLASGWYRLADQPDLAG